MYAFTTLMAEAGMADGHHSQTPAAQQP